MGVFHRLHPALQHQVVSALGWTSLRPVQELAIEATLDGRNVLLLAPTAGGKTEAAFFPLISLALGRPWDGLSVLYVSPIRALLNNQQERIARYYGLVGRKVAVWHGDASPASRKRFLAEPADCLLTTPESLEVMLISGSLRHDRLFANVRAIVVDEVHAFAGDDRGWHLLALIQRITRLAGRDIQRIGLSATVGNEVDLLSWLSAGSDRPRHVVKPPPVAEPEPEVQIDYVGNLDNAARVVAALHRGEKRLVFCDSRARVEQLAANLRSRGVSTFVSHSSLSREERQQAEHAFTENRDCVIVATSALELGIDVGDLDRVIQVDAPGTVSSFLQRMGRTGRRPGATRNCLFLACSDEALLRASGLVRLWRSGYIEPAIPPPEPLHILAQQLLALALQEKGIGRNEWFGWIRGVPAFRDTPEPTIRQIVAAMIDKELLWDEAGVLWLGRAGESGYGRKNFLGLVSVFTFPPLFRILHGNSELGFVDESTFLVRSPGDPLVLSLAGRSWRVEHVDWKRRKAHVSPAEERGRSRWRGEGQFLSYRLCREIRKVLAEDTKSPDWSRRATDQIDVIRADYPWATEIPDNMLVIDRDQSTWWTFAGGLSNSALAGELSQRLGSHFKADSFAIRCPSGLRIERVEEAIHELSYLSAPAIQPAIDESALDGLKFAECLPEELAGRVIRLRLTDEEATRDTLMRPTRIMARQ
jgi:ATP-dependent Lhr-like helicase